MKSIFALALALALMAGPSFAQRSDGIAALSDAASAVAAAPDFGLSTTASKGGEEVTRGSDDIKEAPLSQGSLVAVMIMAAMAGLLVVQRQRS
ncbi:MAG: hypothetical protein WCP77_00470 [Roseococcus sp.]